MPRIFPVLLLTICVLELHAQLQVKPQLFLDGVVSTDLNERDLAISPDGTEMYYTLQSNQNAFSTILSRKKVGNTWSAPTVASFSGRFADLEPAFSKDGKKLYFSSNRPLSGDKPKDYDIWMVNRIKGSWSTPENLGKVINTNANEFYPSVAENGSLYFTAEYDKGIGKEDIYVSRWVNGNFEESAALDTAVNSNRWEFNAFVSPDESFILFTSYGRKDDLGGGDLYISLKDASGKWLTAKNLTAVNSAKLDYCPFVSTDKKIFYFTSSRHALPSSYPKATTYDELVKMYNSTSNGSENIYWVDFDQLLQSLN